MSAFCHLERYSLRSFDPVDKCETSRSIRLQSGRGEVELELDPKGATDEVVETALYLLQMRRSGSVYTLKGYSAPHLPHPENIENG